MNPHLTSNQTVLQVINDELERYAELSDVKYQDITYHMDNTGKTVKYKEEKQIDFLKVANEMKDLDCNYEWNYITFHNRKTNECVQFKRLEQNRWYADVPINDGKNWEGYYWAAYGDSKTIMDMLRLFFDETPWFGMLAWKMRKYKK